MAKNEEQTPEEKSIHAQRETKRLTFGIPAFTLKDLQYEIEMAETQGRKEDLKLLRDALPKKQAEAHQKLIEQSKRAIEACKRSGTAEQLAAEQARLEQYLASPPKMMA